MTTRRGLFSLLASVAASPLIGCAPSVRVADLHYSPHIPVDLNWGGHRAAATLEWWREFERLRAR